MLRASWRETSRAPACAASAPQPPVAKRIPRVTELHGEKLVDNYFWLRERSNSAVVAYLKAENAYTDAMMKPAEKLEKSLYKEMVKRIKWIYKI